LPFVVLFPGVAGGFARGVFFYGSSVHFFPLSRRGGGGGVMGHSGSE